MFTHFDHRRRRTIFTLHPGEHLVTNDDVIIATILGSCVGVAMWDRVREIGGLNHFMLPGSINRKEYYLSDSGKYGMYAMELLVNDFVKGGSQRQDLVAKVFGGGSVIRNTGGLPASRAIPDSNIDFAFAYLETEGIPVQRSDVGGNYGRKIIYYPREFRVLVKPITGGLITAVVKEETELLQKINRQPPGKSDITLF
ncbi:MAG TPA: chemotaxis protein CheD [Spirochaetia bacterium]|nr:chemotaxis protein CheD [Spirochaetia bacterium]